MDGPKNISDLDIRNLLEAVLARYGFDFRDYCYASLRRRICNLMRAVQLDSVGELRRRVLHDPACMELFLLSLSVNTTSMFRDPDTFLALRTQVVPHLRTYPFIRIWHVGCSTGEEVYSTSILLKEEGLLPRCRIYATDMNEAVLAKAKAGIFPLAPMREYTQNYLKAGGSHAFSDYYSARYDHVVFDRSLTDNVVFAQHNLVADGSFNEFQLILRRNVTIYFNKTLQDRVHRLLYESLCTFGFLALGCKDSIKFTPHERCYEELHGGCKLYRRIA